MFNTSTNSSFGGFSNTATNNSANPMKDFEVSWLFMKAIHDLISSMLLQVVNPPDDSIQCLEFSPSTLNQDFLIAGSWDNNVRYLFLMILNSLEQWHDWLSKANN